MDWLDITTTLLGLLYIIFEYRASILLWYVGIVMPLLDIWLYYTHGLYGDAGMAAYYTLAAVWGLLVWRYPGFRFWCASGFRMLRWQRNKQDAAPTAPLPITHMPARLYLPTFAFFLLAWGATYYVLIAWTNSTVPVLDSFTNALSFVGLWALSRKYIEQWGFWIIVDAVCTFLYIQKGIPFKAGLYGLYVVIAVFGWRRWAREAKAATVASEATVAATVASEATVAGSFAAGPNATVPDGSPSGAAPSLPLSAPFDCVILADGAFPRSPLSLRLITEAPMVIFCDGAARHLLKVATLRSNSASFVIVGDGDSVPEEYRSSALFHHESEQDDNDLTKATRYAVSHGMRRIAYLGASGGREDHLIGNVSLISRYHSDLHLDPVMITDHGYFVAATGNASFETEKGQQVSIFNFGCAQLSSEGLRYDCYAFNSWWQGTLNEALGTSFTIHADGSYLVYRLFKA